MAKKQTKDIDNLIDSLSGDLAESSKACCPTQRFVLWLAISTAIVSGFLYFVGIRPDINIKASAPFFLMDMALAASLTLTAGYSAFLLCLPDRAGKGWFTAIPLTLLATFIVWSIIKATTSDFTLPEFHLTHCVKNAGAIVIAPAALIVFITARKSGVTAPYLLMSMNLIAPAAISYLGLRASCMMDTTGHDVIYHMVPFLALGIILGLVARRLYRW